MHKKINRFQFSGIILSDSDIPRKRAQYTNLLIASIRSQGYIPVLDIDPSFSTEYTGDRYEFLISVYAIYVGIRKAEKWEGYSMGRYLPRLSEKIISEESSTE